MDVAPFSSHGGSVSPAPGVGLISQWRKLRHSAAEQALRGHTANSGRTGSSAGASCHPHASQAQEPRPGALYTLVGWRVACSASGGPPVPCGIAWSAHCMGAFCILQPLLLFPVALVGRRCPGAVSLGQARVPSLPLRRLSLAPVLSGVVLDPGSPSCLWGWKAARPRLVWPSGKCPSPSSRKLPCLPVRHRPALFSQQNVLFWNGQDAHRRRNPFFNSYLQRAQPSTAVDVRGPGSREVTSLRSQSQQVAGTAFKPDGLAPSLLSGALHRCCPYIFRHFLTTSSQ